MKLLLFLLPFQVLAQADFTYSISGATVDFIATNPTGFVYEWNYGDGSMDTAFKDSSSHSYTLGSYLVKMRVFDTTFLLLDSAEKVVNIQATGIDERQPYFKELKGDLYDLNGRFISRFSGDISVPTGVYILVSKTGSRKIFLQ